MREMIFPHDMKMDDVPMDISDERRMSTPTLSSAGVAEYDDMDEVCVDDARMMKSPVGSSAGGADDDEEWEGFENQDVGEEEDDDENPLGDIEKLGEQYPSDEADEAEGEPDSAVKHGHQETADDGTVTVTLDFNAIKKESEGRFGKGKYSWENKHLGEGFSNDDVFNGLVVHPNNLHGTLFLRLAEQVCTKEIEHRINALLQCCKLRTCDYNNYTQRWKNAVKAKAKREKKNPEREVEKFADKRSSNAPGQDGKVFLPDYRFLNQPDGEPKEKCKRKNPIVRNKTETKSKNGKKAVDSSQQSDPSTQALFAQSASASAEPSTQSLTQEPSSSGGNDGASKSPKLSSLAPEQKAAGPGTQQQAARHILPIQGMSSAGSQNHPPPPHLRQGNYTNSMSTFGAYPGPSVASKKIPEDSTTPDSETHTELTYEGRKVSRAELLEVIERLDEDQMVRLFAMAKQMANENEKT